MKKLDLSKTYVEFLLEKGEDYNLKTVYDNHENSELLKEFSFKLIEEESTLGKVLDFLKTHDVNLPDLELLNDKHEDKIYHLALSLYTSIYIEKSLSELQSKNEKLSLLSTDIESIGSLEDAESANQEIEANNEQMNQLKEEWSQNYLPNLKDPEAVKDFLLQDNELDLDNGKEIAKRQTENLLENDSASLIGTFVSEVRAAIDRLDILISKYQTIIDSHDVSIEAENNEMLAISEESLKGEELKTENRDEVIEEVKEESKEGIKEEHKEVVKDAVTEEVKNDTKEKEVFKEDLFIDLTTQENKRIRELNNFLGDKDIAPKI